MPIPSKTVRELQVDLGKRLRALRLRRNISQQQLADKAGLSLRALINLEGGAGSSVATFVRVLKALDHTAGIELLAPEPQVSPLALLKKRHAPQRAGHPRTPQRPT